MSEYTGDQAPPARAADPEKGLRGVMSAILILEAVALLLGLTVISNGGASAPAWQIVVVLVLGLVHAVVPAVIARSWALILVFVLQALVIAAWAIAPGIGITGIIFALVWVGVVLMRREFRRRLAAHRLAQ